MITPLCSIRRPFGGILLAAAAAVLLGGSVAASDRYCIPLPPPCPEDVVWGIHDFVNRVIGDINRIASSGRYYHYYEPPRTSQRSRVKPSVPPRYQRSYEISAADLEEEARLLSEMDRARSPSPKPSKETAKDDARESPITPPQNAPSPAEGKTTAPDTSQIPFASPVPGKRGLVYPPGAEANKENMVDVSDYQPGQTVRDPRTGKLFRVP